MFNYHIYQCHNIWALRKGKELVRLFATLDEAKKEIDVAIFKYLITN